MCDLSGQNSIICPDKFSYIYEGVIKCQTKIQKLKFVFQRKKKQELQEILKPKKLSISAFLRNYIQNFIKGEKENASKN